MLVNELRVFGIYTNGKGTFYEIVFLPLSRQRHARLEYQILYFRFKRKRLFRKRSIQSFATWAKREVVNLEEELTLF